jgi:hypothetical protein
VFGGEEELVVTGYIDASFQIDVGDSKSQSGLVFCLNGGSTSKQMRVIPNRSCLDYKFYF